MPRQPLLCRVKCQGIFFCPNNRCCIAFNVKVDRVFELRFRSEFEVLGLGLGLEPSLVLFFQDDGCIVLGLGLGLGFGSTLSNDDGGSDEHVLYNLNRSFLMRRSIHAFHVSYEEEDTCMCS